MVLLLACAVIFFLGTAWIIRELVVEGRENEHLAACVRQLWAERGISVTGVPFDNYKLNGDIHGVSLQFASDVNSDLPNGTTEPLRLSQVKFAAPIPDLVLCRTADIDRIMGMLPHVAKTSTTNADFDCQYGLFVTALVEPTACDFRSAPANAALRWATSEVLQRMLDLKVVSMRVKEGQCELNVERVHLGQVDALLCLASDVGSLVQQRQPVKAVAQKAILPKPARALDLVLAGIGTAMTGVLVLWIPLGWLLKGLTEEYICGPNDTLRYDEFWFACENNSLKATYLHFIASELTWLAMVSVVLAVVLMKASAIRREWGASLKRALLSNGTD